MGVDLLVTVLPYPLDWIVGAFNKMTENVAAGILSEQFGIEPDTDDGRYEGWLGQGSTATAFGVLNVKMKEALRYFNTGDYTPRDVVISRIGPDTDSLVLVAGGDSWGDSTDGFDHAHLLSEILWWAASGRDTY